MKPITPASIKDARLRRGWTQGELASKTGVSFVTVNRWENGKTSPSPLAEATLREVLFDKD